MQYEIWSSTVTTPDGEEETKTQRMAKLNCAARANMTIPDFCRLTDAQQCC